MSYCFYPFVCQLFASFGFEVKKNYVYVQCIQHLQSSVYGKNDTIAQRSKIKTIWWVRF